MSVSWLHWISFFLLLHVLHGRAMAFSFLLGRPNKPSEGTHTHSRETETELKVIVPRCPQRQAHGRPLHSRQSLPPTWSIDRLFSSSRPSRPPTIIPILHSSSYVYTSDLVSNYWWTYLCCYRASSWRDSITLCCSASVVRAIKCRLKYSTRLHIVTCRHWLGWKQAASSPAHGWEHCTTVILTKQGWSSPDQKMLTVVGISTSMVD